MNRDQRYNASKKGKQRDKRRETSEYRRGYRNGYAAGRRASARVEVPRQSAAQRPAASSSGNDGPSST